MLGHDWEKVTGKVVERHGIKQWNKGDSQISPSFKYVVEATLPDGSSRSEELDDYIGTRQFSLTNGRQVALLYDKHGRSWTARNCWNWRNGRPRPVDRR